MHMKVIPKASVYHSVSYGLNQIDSSSNDKCKLPEKKGSIPGQSIRSGNNTTNYRLQSYYIMRCYNF